MNSPPPTLWRGLYPSSFLVLTLSLRQGWDLFEAHGCHRLCMQLLTDHHRLCMRLRGCNGDGMLYAGSLSNTWLQINEEIKEWLGTYGGICSRPELFSS